MPSPFLAELQRCYRPCLLATLLALASAFCTVSCGENPASTRTESRSLQLVLSPSNPQVAQGTAQQFSLRGLWPDGHVVDLTEKAAWRVFAEADELAQPAKGGLIELAMPGRYRVLVEYDGQRMETPLIVTAAALRSLFLNPTAPKLAQGLTQQLKATATFTDGTTQDVSAAASWSVKDVTGSRVATVSTSGLATAKDVGTARITARYMSSSASITLEVTPVTLQTLAISPENPRITKGTSHGFVATGSFSDGTTAEVSSLADWFVTDAMGSNVASIDGTGLATGDNVGQAKVEAEYQGLLAQTTLTVTSAAVVSLTLSPTTAALAKGTVQRFTVTAGLSDGSTQDVSVLAAWTATDLVGSGVASVDASGKATGQAVGQARIDCAYRGYRASATLEVKSAALLGLRLTPTSASVPRGRSQAFLLTGSYNDGSTQDLTTVAVWTAKDLMGSDVTSVSGSGVALGKNPGQAEIAAEHIGTRATATLTVADAKPTALTLAPSNPRITVGKTVQFTVQGRYSDGTTQDLSTLCSYSATDLAPGSSGVAMISASGLAIGNRSGQAKIAASCLGLVTETTLTVDPSNGICSIDGWCWQNPLPQGNWLNGVWGSDANNVWAVGWNGTILKWNGSNWTAQASGTSQILRGVWGSDANNVWAVGEYGTILKWNGSTWTAQASGTMQTLRSVWGGDANNVWAVGWNGTILKWNGSSWTVQASGTSNPLTGIWGHDSINVWAVGYMGTILKWNGSTWATQANGTSEILTGIWGSDATNIWAVGWNGTILKWNGSTWATQASGTTKSFYGIWGSDASNVWALAPGDIGGTGTIFKWNGSTWATQASGTMQIPTSIWGNDASNVWIVGEAGKILKWNGSSWAAQGSGITQGLYGIWGSDANNIWAVGRMGTILKWNGSTWAPQASGSTEVLVGAWGRDAKSVWAVGRGATILKWNGSSWAAQSSGGSILVSGIWGTDANNIWAVAQYKTILKWNGSSWVQKSRDLRPDLYGIWGSDAGNIWAVGGSETILKGNGLTWAVQSSGLSQNLYGVWGSDVNNVWAVGAAGTILKWNGRNWIAQSSGTMQALHGIWGSDANNVWAVGEAGTILKWNGSSWSQQSSGTSARFYGVWGSDAKIVWVVGDSGTILRWTP